jgi:hypothetical protein
MSGETLFALILLIGILALFYINARTWRRDQPRSTPPDEPFAEATPRPKRRTLPPAKPIATLEIEYADAQGEVTERRISIIQIDATVDDDGNFYPESMRAYCHMRKGNRTFMVGRIERLYLPGETTPIRRRAEIYAWFAELCRQTAEAENSQVTRK